MITETAQIAKQAYRIVPIALLALTGCKAIQPPPQPLMLEEQAAYEACEERIYAYWRQKGLQEFGDSTSYIGAGGAIQKEQVLDQCGQRPTTRSQRGLALLPQDCNNVYTWVFLNCVGKREYLDSNHARGWVKSLDSRIFDKSRLGSLCEDGVRISREEFGILMCGE